MKDLRSGPKELRTGPTLVTGTIDLYREDSILPTASSDKNTEHAAALVSAAIVAIPAVIMGSDKLDKWTSKKKSSAATRYVRALDHPEVLWTLVASQLLVGNFPNPLSAHQQMAIMDSESRFKIDALNPSKAFGLMQVFPTNVKNIANWPHESKMRVIAKLRPVVRWVKSVSPSIGIAMEAGAWPKSLAVSAPLWQIPFVAVLWNEANLDLNRAFKWNGKEWIASTEGAFPVRNRTFLAYMKANPSIFQNKDRGETAILANLWKHGGPNGLYKDAHLHYLNKEVDHITPVVDAFINLQQQNEVPEVLKTLMLEL